MTSSARERFITDMGNTLATWNLSRATGRVYGALLLKTAVSTSDELRSELSLSAGAVSTAIRELVSWGLVRTVPQPGSRRLLVEAAGGFEQLLAASHERTRAFVRTLRAGEALTADAGSAARLRDVTDLFTSYVEAGEQVLEARARA